jgi:hypothetical protein
LVQTLLFAAATARWWAHRQGHLFGQGEWIAGKDRVKFLFYTYQFLFQPLDGAVDLASAQGHQEILWPREETPDRRLKAVTLDATLQAGSYLWIQFHRRGDRFLGIRLSRKSGFEGGCFRFDQRGDLALHLPFLRPPPFREDGAIRVECLREGDRWLVRGDGTLLGDFPAGAPDGEFGLRGSGFPRARVLVSRVDLSLEDPSAPGGVRTVTREFRARPGPRAALAALLLALAATLLRLAARRASAPGRDPLPPGEEAALALGTLLCLLVPPPTSGVHLPLLVLLGEVLRHLPWLRDGLPGDSPEAPGTSSAPRLFMAALVLVPLGVALLLRGDLAGWRRVPDAPLLRGVHPGAYLALPPPGERAPFSLPGPVTLRPGAPLFAPGSRSRQAVTALFTLTPGATLDVVLQQQSLRTHGDPDGEELPRRRRLVRLSTDPGIPSGVSRGTGNRPGPFPGGPPAVTPGVPHRLRIEAGEDRVILSLDGVETGHRDLPPLGEGETGFMVHDGEALLGEVQVRPGGGLAWSRLPGGSLFPLVVLVPLAVTFLLGRLTPRPRRGACRAAALGTFLPLAVHGTAILLTPRGDLAFLEAERILSLDVALLATATSLSLLVIALRRDLPRPALAFNLAALLTLAVGGLAVWEILPESHPLKAVRSAALLPGGGERRGGEERTLPWIADPETIGASTYPWRQELGGEPAGPEKAPGEVRVVLLGGSQAWGAGARGSAGTFAALLEEELRADGLPVNVLNAGVNASGIVRARDLYRGPVRRLAPDLVVADVGLNDSAWLAGRRGERGEEAEALARAFRSLARLCRKDGVRLLLVLEPISGESPLRPDGTLYGSLEAIAREEGVPVLDPSPTLRRLERDHQVWWDAAHLTPFGHRTMAGIMEGPVGDLVRDVVARRPGGGATPRGAAPP